MSQAMVSQMIEKATGPLLIAYLASWGFQGVLCVQVYQYYRAFPNDRHFLKVLVYGVFVLEVVQSGLMARDAFDTFVVGFANGEALNNFRLLWLSIPILGGIRSLCRLFMIYRLYYLSRSWISTLLATILASTVQVTALLTGIEFGKAKVYTNVYKQRFYILIGLWGGSGAACDVFVAVSMVYYLLRQKVNFKRTHARITCLIIVTVETGVLTAAMAALSFLLFILMKRTSYFTLPAMIVAKLYSNTMLLGLNNRINIVGGRNDQETYSDHLFGSLELSQWDPHRDSKWESPSPGSAGV